MSDLARLYEGVPFLDREGKPAVGGLIVAEPKGGRIVERFEWQGIALVAFLVDHCTHPDWRVLIPAAPIRVDRVEMTRAEGRIAECGKLHVARGEYQDWPSYPDAGPDGKVWFNAIAKATSKFGTWGISAPRTGGYDKCDVKTVWEDGSNYGGRFDLEYGGTDGGQDFRAWLLRGLYVYAGLKCPGRWSMDQYLRYLEDIVTKYSPGMVENCRHVLAHCEL